MSIGNRLATGIILWPDIGFGPWSKRRPSQSSCWLHCNTIAAAYEFFDLLSSSNYRSACSHYHLSLFLCVFGAIYCFTLFPLVSTFCFYFALPACCCALTTVSRVRGTLSVRRAVFAVSCIWINASARQFLPCTYSTQLPAAIMGDKEGGEYKCTRPISPK